MEAIERLTALLMQVKKARCRVRGKGREGVILARRGMPPRRCQLVAMQQCREMSLDAGIEKSEVAWEVCGGGLWRWSSKDEKVEPGS